MARVTIQRPGNITINAEMSIDELKEFMGMNGNGPAPVTQETRNTGRGSVDNHDTVSFEQFYEGLADRSRRFVDAVFAAGPSGIESTDLAKVLGFTQPRQIGGLTGGGLAKSAKKAGLTTSDIYATGYTSTNGKDQRVFYPGPFLKARKSPR